MSTLELARLQFGIVTVFHFLFVPVTIGLSLFTAYCQTKAYRTGSEIYRRMTTFWGRLMLISFAVGVVTGIVQEFQFGMNWSDYSRYVGDIFGAPLAMEGLAAFFVESTFIGLWIFGKGRISPRLHLATIWAVAGSTVLSAYFILAANSWMQHPVGYEIDRASGRAELTSIWAVLTNSTALMAFAHTIFAAITTAGMVVVAVSAYGLLRGKAPDVFGRSMRFALPAVCAAVLGTMAVGHFQGDLLEDQQPMKMAAAEALFETEKGAGMSLFATGDFSRNPGKTNRNLQVPKALSLISTLDPNGVVRGINDIQRDYVRRYGPGDYVPIVAVTYWTWRAMIGAGTAMLLIALAGLFLSRRRRLEVSPRFLKIALIGGALPFIANSAGWIFTEMGRQPWIVQGLLKTSDGVSPSVGTGEVLVTLIGFTSIYTVLALVAGRLFLREVRDGPSEDRPAPAGVPDLTLTY